jgi:Uma2 family endonuclease
MASLPQHRISPEEYVALEEKLGGKFEYHDGQIFAMSGGSPVHARLQVMLARRIDEKLDGSPCTVYSSDLRVVIDTADMSTYPDLSIVCGPIVPAPRYQHSCTNPTVLFEVLSPSTEAYDRGTKFEQYRKLSTLREYVLVSQTEPAVDLFRLEDGRWIFLPIRGLDAVLELASVNIAVPLADIFRDISFDDAE